MENPCEKCIIKVNCTEVCLEKQNYETILHNAIKQYKNAMNTRDKRQGDYYFKKYRDLLSKSAEHHGNIAEINKRKLDCMAN